MRTITTASLTSTLIGCLLMVPMTLSGCDDDECTSNSDCPSGRICQLGLCVRAFGPDTGLGDIDVTLDCDDAAPGDLVLNEILADPPTGSDPNDDGVSSSRTDEFVEVVNVADKPVGLKNVMIDVNGSQKALGAFCLDPNTARVLFGADGLPQLANNGATVTLLIDGLTAQTHTYGSEAGRDSAVTLTTQLDASGGWSVHKDVWGTAYSPGTCANGNAFPDCSGSTVVENPDGEVSPPDCTATPVAGDLLINEILADPTGLDANDDGTVHTAEDEYVEIVNVSSKTLQLQGATIAEAGGKVWPFPTNTCLAAGQGAVVFGSYVDQNVTFQGSLGFGFEMSFPLNNGGDTVTLKNAADELLDEVTYGSEGGSAQSLVREYDLHPASLFVRHTTAPRSGGARMSPGTCQNGSFFPNCGGGPGDDVDTEVTDTGDTTVVSDTAADTAADTEVVPACSGAPAAVGDLRINEIMSDPNAGGATGIIDFNQDGVGSSTQDEFVEIVSVASVEVELKGAKIIDEVGTTFEFKTSVCLQPNHAVLVFGGGTPYSDQNASKPAGTAAAQTGLPGLRNSGDAVILRSAAGAEIDSYTYTTLKAKSWVRSPDATGAFVDHSTVTDTVGRASPGTCSDGSAFPGCLQ